LGGAGVGASVDAGVVLGLHVSVVGVVACRAVVLSFFAPFHRNFLDAGGGVVIYDGVAMKVLFETPDYRASTVAARRAFPPMAPSAGRVETFLVCVEFQYFLNIPHTLF
jgi:hypothetical protein